MKFKITLYLLITQITLTTSQTIPATGLLRDDDSYNRTLILPIFDGTKFDEIPFRLSLRPYAPQPGDQGEIGSCIGWALGYGAMTITRAIQQSETDREKINQMANSASFIFNQIKVGNCGQGAYLNDGLDFLQKQGDCLSKTFPNSTTSCDIMPVAHQLQEAGGFKIKEYATVFSTEATPERKIKNIRQLLVDSIPVIIGMSLDNNFAKLNKSNAVWKPAEHPEYLLNHVMLVTGYDETRQRFEIMNSYGTEWGKAGFFYVDYDDFANHCFYGYIFLLEEEDAHIKMEGAFQLRKPMGQSLEEDGGIIFEAIKVTYNATNELYEVSGDQLKKGDLFQLVTNRIPQGQHVYVFSLDPKGKADLHWPKNKQQVSFVPSKYADIIIPSKESALKLVHQGADHLCVVYSYNQITDIEDRVKRLQNISGTFQEKLNQVFRDVLLLPSEISLHKKQMTFSAIANAKRKAAVALILKVITE